MGHGRKGSKKRLRCVCVYVWGISDMRPHTRSCGSCLNSASNNEKGRKTTTSVAAAAAAAAAAALDFCLSPTGGHVVVWTSLTPHDVLRRRPFETQRPAISEPVGIAMKSKCSAHTIPIANARPG